MFNVGKYFYKTGTLGTVSGKLYAHIIFPPYYHCGTFEAARVRGLHQQKFRPEGTIVKQLRRMDLFEDA